MFKYLSGGLILVWLAGPLCGDAQNKDNDLAPLLIGEWSASAKGEKGREVVIVLTFRASGVCRLDGIDAVTRKQLRGPRDRLPGVGLWKFKGKEVVVIWENWTEGKQRPIQVEQRMRLEKLTEKELIYRTLLPGRAEKDQQISKWKRFEGWVK